MPRFALLFLSLPLFSSLAARGAEPDTSGSIEKLKKVVALMAAGDLAADEHGIVALGERVAGVAMEQAYVTGPAKTPDYVLFPVFRGKGANVRGYLYAPGGLVKIGQEIAVRGPIPVADMPTAKVEITLDAKVSPDWYIVSRTLD